jgi:hypothetical protein
MNSHKESQSVSHRALIGKGAGLPRASQKKFASKCKNSLVGGREEVAQIMSTHVSKCKNDKNKIKSSSEEFLKTIYWLVMIFCTILKFYSKL